MLVDPGAGGDVRLRVAQNHAVADDLAPRGNGGRGDFVGLGDRLQGFQTRLDFHTGLRVVDGDGYIVFFADFDGKTAHSGNSFFGKRVEASSFPTAYRLRGNFSIHIMTEYGTLVFDNLQFLSFFEMLHFNLSHRLRT